jgi:ankyrin repeat protein
VRLLLQYEANPDLVMQNGWTSLIYACETNRLPSIVEEFFKYGANPNARDAQGVTALGLACFRNHPDLVKVLLSNGADPNLPGKELPVLTSLLYPTCLELLIAAGADVHSYKGLMVIATYSNCIESVKLLLDAGVDPNEKLQETYSPLTTAIRDNHPEILALLLSRGADPNLMGEDVPVKMAVNKPELLMQLLDHGADVSLYKGLIALAVYYNTLDSIPILLEAGVPVDEKYLDIHTGVTTAIRENRIECLSFPLSHSADPNEPGEGLPIAHAVRFADPQMLHMLLDAGADVNRQYNGRTALMDACEYNMGGNVGMLLEIRASVDVVDNGGHTAMDIAAYKGHYEIMMLLLDGLP